MKNVLVLTISLLLSLVSLNAQNLGSNPNDPNNSNVSYSSELISAVQERGSNDAISGKSMFNEYSTTLDITLFGYYSEAYKAKKQQLSQSSGGGGNSSLPSQLSKYEEEYTENMALWKLINRLNGKN